MIGMAAVMLFFVLIYKMVIMNTVSVGDATSSQIKIMLSIPALLAYTIMPLAQGIWQKIYS
jgi:hypothetical protein